MRLEKKLKDQKIRLFFVSSPIFGQYCLVDFPHEVSKNIKYKRSYFFVSSLNSALIFWYSILWVSHMK
jgi:hypothetical protein